jgi:hypothetical protein
LGHGAIAGVEGEGDGAYKTKERMHFGFLASRRTASDWDDGGC